MRLCVEFATSSNIARFPIAYNHGVQGLIYRLLSEELRDFLHDQGFANGKRRMKLFTFSRLIGAFKRSGDSLVFRTPIRLWISSPFERFMNELANSLLKTGKVVVLGNELHVTAMSVPKRPELREPVVCKTLSPVTVYSTLVKPDGGKKTYYWSPYEREFSELASKNLVRKASLITGNNISGHVEVRPYREGACREVVCLFKGTVVKAWEGFFELRGDRRLLETMYDAGLGSKNSSGFGMIEVFGNA